MKPALDIKCVLCSRASNMIDDYGIMHDCMCRGCSGPQDNEFCSCADECTLSPDNDRCYWHEYYYQLVITTA